jgi:hypothetical protein
MGGCRNQATDDIAFTLPGFRDPQKFCSSHISDTVFYLINYPVIFGIMAWFGFLIVSLFDGFFAKSSQDSTLSIILIPLSIYEFLVSVGYITHDLQMDTYLLWTKQLFIIFCLKYTGNSSSSSFYTVMNFASQNIIEELVTYFLSIGLGCYIWASETDMDDFYLEWTSIGTYLIAILICKVLLFLS